MTNTVAFQIVSMSKEEADRMYKSDWWVNTDWEAASQRQLFTEQMIMPFDLYFEGLKKLLKRDVNQAEALMFGDLRAEYLGLKTRPEYAEIQSAIEAHGDTVSGIRIAQAVVEVVDERE